MVGVWEWGGVGTGYGDEDTGGEHDGGGDDWVGGRVAG